MNTVYNVVLGLVLVVLVGYLAGGDRRIRNLRMGRRHDS